MSPTAAATIKVDPAASNMYNHGPEIPVFGISVGSVDLRNSFRPGAGNVLIRIGCVFFEEPRIKFS